MDKKLKNNLILVTFGVILFAAVMNIGAVLAFLKMVLRLAYPVVFGFLIAFILNVPMRGFENLFGKLSKKLKKPLKKKTISGISLALTFLCVLLVVTLVFTMLVPELISSVQSLYNIVAEKLPTWLATLKEYDIDTTKIVEWFESINIETLLSEVTNSAGTVITSVVTFASSAVTGVTEFIIAIIIAVYVLLSKRSLSYQCKKLMEAHLKPKTVNFTYHVSELISNTFSKFLSGQCVEACILGVLIFISFTIFKIPYASLIGILTAVCAFVPYVGAFISCFIGAFMVLLANPEQVIIAIIIYLVVQFIETQLIYPHVVGTSVGLSPLLTLIAVLIGGSLFGLFGMIFFIPICAVLVTLISEYTNKVIHKKIEESND